MNSFDFLSSLEPNEYQGKDVFFEFYPKRQSLHKDSDVKIVLVDPDGLNKKSKITAYYQGKDITETFFAHADSIKDKNRWLIHIHDLKLPLNKDHSIVLKYEKNELKTVAKWLPPSCDLFAAKAIQTTAPFKPKQRYLASINKLAKTHNFNPNLVAALVAQESSFNPRAISWSKAIGLTQVTPVADAQIKEFRSTWPRAPEVKKLPVTLLKPLVRAGQITKEDDWRLNPDLSIEGGILYLEYLTNYWQLPQNQSLIKEKLSQDKHNFTDFILASYNSGGARVGYAMKLHGDNYLNYVNLKEAKKYVKKVTSYCYHFGEKETEF